MTNNSNYEEVDFTITHRSMEFKTDFYGLNKKIKIARRNGFIINRLKKLTSNFFSSLSILNKRYHLNFRIPIVHRQVIKILTQNPEYV